MKPFNEDRECEKCGNQWAKNFNIRFGSVEHFKESLVVTCTVCSFSWEEHCKDHKK